MGSGQGEVFHKDEWMVRPCDMYKEEYSDCTSIKARFHQHFVHGESTDCSQWKKDFDNCMKWVGSNDPEALKAVIESEKIRRINRLDAHYKNNTWVKRKEPPADWNKPLPEWMVKEYKDSYLDHKSQEMKDGSHNVSSIENRTLCVIS